MKITSPVCDKCREPMPYVAATISPFLGGKNQNLCQRCVDALRLYCSPKSVVAGVVANEVRKGRVR